MITLLDRTGNKFNEFQASTSQNSQFLKWSYSKRILRISDQLRIKRVNFVFVHSCVMCIRKYRKSLILFVNNIYVILVVFFRGKFFYPLSNAILPLSKGKSWFRSLLWLNYLNWPQMMKWWSLQFACNNLTNSREIQCCERHQVHFTEISHAENYLQKKKDSLISL